MFFKNLKSAYRHLIKEKVFSVLNIVGLATSLAIIIIISSWVRSELTFDQYPDGDRIFRVLGAWDMENGLMHHGDMPYPLADDLQDQSAAVESITRLLKSDWTRPTVRFKDLLTYEESFAYVDDNWFEFFDLGGDGQALLFPNNSSIYLSETRAKKIFGDSDPIGEVLLLDQKPFEVAGVVDDPPANSSFQIHMYAAVGARLSDSAALQNDMDWGNWNYSTFVKVRSSDFVQQVEQIGKEILASHTIHDHFDLEPITDMHFNDKASLYAGAPIGNRRSIGILSLIGILICLSAGFNYINLTLACVSEREKEVGIRKLMGSSRKNLVGKFVLEGALIVGAAFAFAIVLGHYVNPLLQKVGIELPNILSYSEKWMALPLMACILLVLIAVYPALVISGIKPLKLVGQGHSKSPGMTFRKILIVGQFVISTVLIICAIVIGSQQRFMMEHNLGYNVDHVLQIAIPSAEIERGDREFVLHQITAAIKQQPGVESCSHASAQIVNMASWTRGSLSWPGMSEGYAPGMYQLSVSENYDITMDLRMQSGHWFDREMKSDANNIIVNEMAARLIDFPEIIGQEVTFQGKTGRIIGVAKDFHFHSLHSEIEPLVMFYRPTWSSSIYVKASEDKVSDVIASVEAIWQERFPEKPFEYSFMDDTYQSLYESEQTHASLTKIFSFFAIIISCLGLVGLALYSARRRRREIGIRKVLGASTPGVLLLLTREYSYLILISILIASAGSFALMSAWLDNYAYAIPLTISPFLLGALIMSTIAFATVSIMSSRAALENPVETLRNN